MQEKQSCKQNHRWHIGYFFMRMKLCMLFVCTLTFTLSANTLAQHERLNLNLKDVSVKTLLDEIQKQTKLCFLFNPEQTEQLGKLSLQAKNETVENVLNRILNKSSLTFVVKDDLIMIMPKDELQDDKTQKSIQIKGRVTDTKKNPIPGVTVIVKGTDYGTVTNANGEYKLSIPRIKDVSLSFSFVGMATQHIKYTGLEIMNVTMEEDVKTIEEVVVTGYLDVRKESFTGNVTTVSKDQLLQTNNKNVIAALQTFDPSFRIKENNLWGSDPNALPEFNIRGESSIELNKGLEAEQNRRTQRTNLKDNPNLPIFILDGFQVDVEKIYDMDMNRIASMTILKDAAATAMYGSQAANGVVVVTTVAPKPGEMRITYNFSGGGDFPDLSDYNLCNAKEMLEVEYLSGLYKAKNPEDQHFYDKEYNERLNNIKKGINTDWMAQPLRNVFNHTHSLNLSGGEESIRYSLDLNYDSNNGVMKGSYRKRVGAGLTLDYRPKDWLQIMNSITYNQTKSKNSPYGDFSTYTAMKPYLPIYDADGNLLEKLTVGSYTRTNPLYKVKYLNDFDGKGHKDDITENLNINMYFMNGFQFKGQFSIRKSTGKTESFTDPKSASQHQAEEDRGRLTQTFTDSWNWNARAMFYYNKMINENHFINATLGTEANENRNSSNTATFTGFGMGNVHSPIYAAKQPNKTNVNKSRARNIGFLGSVNYSFKDIYLFDGSFRFDASSKFGSDKQWAPFWSAGVGINVHNYAFLQDNWLVSTLKIRGSYGSTGNVNFPTSMSTTTYEVATDNWFFTGPAAGLMALGNPNLTWEKTKTVDLGLNLGLFEDKIYLTASYYNKRTEGLIDNISIRTSSGFESYAINSGTIENKGLELNLSATLFRNEDWMVTANANLASNKNTIVKLGESAKTYNEKILAEWSNLKNDYTYKEVLSSPVILYYEGASKSAIYAVRSAGIDPANGKERFIKKNGMSTYTWDANDQVVVGDNTPDAQGSFGFNVGYKGIYLNASFLYQWGAQSYNETLLQKVENANISEDNVDRRVLTQRWQKPGDVVPFYDLKNNTATQVTSRFVQDYNYLNFSGLSVGYDFDKELISKWKLRTLGVRLNVNNLCRWSTVKEERGTNYPFARNFSFTINVGI